MKDLLKNSVISIGMALTIFCVVGVIFDFIYSGNFIMKNYNFTKMVISSIIVGLGFGIPSIIYQNDKIALPMQCLIHMSIGCIIYTLVAFNVGWIPTGKGINICLCIIAGQLAVAILIWIFFLLYYKKMAYEMNKKIKENHFADKKQINK